MARKDSWSLILESENVKRPFTRIIDGVVLMTFRYRLYKLLSEFARPCIFDVAGEVHAGKV